MSTQEPAPPEDVPVPTPASGAPIRSPLVRTTSVGVTPSRPTSPNRVAPAPAPAPSSTPTLVPAQLVDTAIITRSPKNIVTVLSQLEGLLNYHKYVLNIRYIAILNSYRRRCILYAILFHATRLIVTVGSITVPALLSIKYYGNGFDWLTWAISLAVSICNGILTLFKIDKKYYMLHTTLNMLESEGWQYTTLSGKYSKQRDSNEAPSHINQFHHFCLAIEKILMKQVEDEYYKSLEIEKDKTTDKTQNAQSNQNTLVPYSPRIASLDTHELLRVLSNQIFAMAKTEPTPKAAPTPRPTPNPINEQNTIVPPTSQTQTLSDTILEMYTKREPSQPEK